MKIGLVYKKDDVRSKECMDTFKKDSKFDCFSLDEDQRPDLIVCFGGDGTTLRCVDKAVRYNVPIISVNTGNLGFLSAYTPQSLTYLYDHIKNNQVEYEEKTLIETEINGKKYIALNEITVQRALKDYSETAGFYLSIDNKLADDYLADGIIVSTPTGSTAYSLSTGAPILAPDVSALLINAICPHTLSARSMVISDKSTVNVEVKKSNNICYIYCDGVLSGELAKGEEIRVQKSEHTVKIAKINDFYSRLNSKLRSW